MKKSFFIIALSVGMAACSSEAEVDATTETETTETSTADKGKELDRLSAERDVLYDKQIEALESGDLDASNAFKAQMDSVDALYQELLRK